MLDRLKESFSILNKSEVKIVLAHNCPLIGHDPPARTVHPDHKIKLHGEQSKQ